MRIFLAGATGALGSRLVPLLVAARPPGDRHDPHARQGRRPARGAAPSRSSSTPSTATRSSPPSSPRGPTRSCTSSPRSPGWAACATSTARSRSPTGCAPRAPTTCSPARAQAGARRFVAQSYAGWPYARSGGPVKTEDDPLDPDPVPSMSETLARDPPRSRRPSPTAGRDRAALRRLLRPGHRPRARRRAGRAGPQAPLPDRRRRRRRVVVRPRRRRGRRDARRARARRARRDLQRRRRRPRAGRASGCPALAAAAGAKPPRRVPRWLGRVAAGEAVATMMTDIARRVEREGAARARLAPALPELARRLPGRARPRRAGARRPSPASSPRSPRGRSSASHSRARRPSSSRKQTWLSKNGSSCVKRQRTGGSPTPAARASSLPTSVPPRPHAKRIERRSRSSSGLRNGEQVAW